MDDKNYLHTSQYSGRRRRRGCFGIFLFILLSLFILWVIIQLLFPSGSAVPVFGPAVAVVRIEGPINESKDVVKVLHALRENSFVRAIVLRLDTPGGAVGASEEIYREAMKARTENKKHVVASMGNAAASGGYYIACAAEEIVANGGTITGSIGVIAMDWNVESLLQKIGVKSVIIKSGEHKDTGSPFRTMSPEDRKLLQSVIYDAYRQFVSVVLQARYKAILKAQQANPTALADILSTPTTKRADAGLEWEAFTTGTVAEKVGAPMEAEVALREMADGRLFTGDQAKLLGLVDSIGSLDDAVERAGKLSGLGSKPSVIERNPESRIPSLLGACARSFWQAFAREDALVQYRREAE